MRLTLQHYTTQKVIGYGARLDYMRALKTGNATPESSAAFQEILQRAVYVANVTYNAVQLELFGDPSIKERV